MEFSVVASGYCLLEAPRVYGEHVWFSDLLLGGLHRLSRDGRIDVFLPDRKHIGGLALNHDGRLIHSGPGGLLWFDPQTGASGTLLGEGAAGSVNGVNDIYPGANGSLYFGTLPTSGDYSQLPQPVQLCRLDPGGEVVVLDSGLRFANGIGLSPDGKRLYHNESIVGTFAYDVLPDGSLANKARLHPREDVDGLAVDVEGGVWIAHYASGEIARYRPDGSQDGAFALPHKAVISLCFGGPDGRDLYVTTAGDDGIDALLAGKLPPRDAALFRARSEVAGLQTPVTRFDLE